MSGSAILTELQTQPVLIFMIDELQSLVATLSQRNPPQHVRMIAENIKMAYSSADNEQWVAAAYADRAKRIEINQPHLVLMGTGTPKSFWINLNEELLTSGFMGRCLLFEADAAVDEAENDWRDPDPESGMIKNVRRWCEYQPGGNLGSENPKPDVVAYSTEAEDRLKIHRREIRTRARGEDEVTQAMWSRSGQKTCQLALIYAASRCGPTPELRVELQDIDRAVMLSNHSTRRMVWHAQNPYGGEYGQTADRVATKIPQEWTARSEVTRATYRLCTGRQQREQILKDLIEGDVIEFRTVGTAGREREEFRRI